MESKFGLDALFDFFRHLFTKKIVNFPCARIAQAISGQSGIIENVIILKGLFL
jgi:hypothetical protein